MLKLATVNSFDAGSGTGTAALFPIGVQSMGSGTIV